jgi:hypothetical protein
MVTKEFLRLDEIEDVLSSLDLLALIAPLLKSQSSYWKWSILAAHSGLQGAMVCALLNSSVVSVLDKRSARKLLAWLDTQAGPAPDERLADFNTLLCRCGEAARMGGHPLELNNAQINDIKRLHEDFRNEFAHFTPKGWSVEKAGLPRIISAAVDAIERLMNHPRVRHKLSGNKKRRLASCLITIRQELV